MTTKYGTKKHTEALARFFEKLPHGNDIMLVILKGHLLLEEQVREIVDERLINPTSLRDARLSCHQMICLAEALCPKDVEPIIWESAKKLNKLRNDIAHKLDHKGLDDQVANFVKMFPSGFEDTSDSLQQRFEKSLLGLFVLIAALTDKDNIELP